MQLSTVTRGSITQEIFLPVEEGTLESDHRPLMLRLKAIICAQVSPVVAVLKVADRHTALSVESIPAQQVQRGRSGWEARLTSQPPSI